MINFYSPIQSQPTHYTVCIGHFVTANSLNKTISHVPFHSAENMSRISNKDSVNIHQGSLSYEFTVQSENVILITQCVLGLPTATPEVCNVMKRRWRQQCVVVNTNILIKTQLKLFYNQSVFFVGGQLLYQSAHPRETPTGRYFGFIGVCDSNTDTTLQLSKKHLV